MMNIKLKTSLLILLSLIFGIQLSMAQNVGKGLDAVTDKDFGTAKLIFENILIGDDQDVAANYGMSRLYMATGFEDKDPEKAVEYMEKAEAAFAAADDKTVKKLEKNEITVSTLGFQRKNIEKRFLRLAKEEGSVAAIQGFIDRFPNSEIMATAKKDRNELALKNAETANTVEAFTDFITSYPDADGLQAVIDKRDKMAIDLAKEANTSAAMRDFMEKFPESKYTDQIEQLLYAVALDEAKEFGTSFAMEMYIDMYPNSHFINIAQKLLREYELEGK